jgi:hypothetical protein
LESFAAIVEEFAEGNDGKERGSDVSDVFEVGGVFETKQNGCIMSQTAANLIRK